MRGELTAKGRATRRRIVEGAAAVLRERGVATTTLDDIMARTATSKSQLFQYVLLAASPLVDGVTGRYFEDNQEARTAADRDGEQAGGVAPHALEPHAADRLWEYAAETVGR